MLNGMSRETGMFVVFSLLWLYHSSRWIYMPLGQSQYPNTGEVTMKDMGKNNQSQ